MSANERFSGAWAEVSNSGAVLEFSNEICDQVLSLVCEGMINHNLNDPEDRLKALSWIRRNAFYKTKYVVEKVAATFISGEVEAATKPRDSRVGDACDDNEAGLLAEAAMGITAGLFAIADSNRDIARSNRDISQSIDFAFGEGHDISGAIADLDNTGCLGRIADALSELACRNEE